MAKASEIRKQLLGYCQQAQVGLDSCGSELDCLAKSLCTAFYANQASLSPDGKCYKVATSGLEVQLHPSSVLFRRRPKHLMYNELVYTNKLYMKHCSVVDPSWLPELIPA